MQRITLAIAALSLLSDLATQQIPEGFDDSIEALPATAGNVLLTDLGTVYFDGTELVVLAPGLPARTLLTLQSPAFGSFTLQVDSHHVLFGESSNGAVWLVPLNGSPPTQPIANIPFNYDAALLATGSVLISAKTGGFSAPDNDIVRLELSSGSTQTVARFPGASGPVSFDQNGNLYYATSSASFPPPAGATSILRVPNSTILLAIANQSVLGVANTQLVLAGLDAAGDLAFDDDGDLFFTDYINSQIGEINDAIGPLANLAPPLLDYSTAGVSASSLQFVAATSTGSGVFEPFQPAGGRLLVHETDFFSQSRLRSWRARRPTLGASAASPVPIGPFDLIAADGPANGIGLVAFAPATLGVEANFGIPGFESPLRWASALATNPVLVPVVFDSFGSAVLTIVNPGFSPGFDAAIQVVTISTAGALGSTQPLGVQIGQ